MFGNDSVLVSDLELSLGATQLEIGSGYFGGQTHFGGFPLIDCRFQRGGRALFGAPCPAPQIEFPSGVKANLIEI
jgi:hypothetical protein